ncbi:MAG: hypothetical protein Q8889_02015 [Candidatus Phytoplasma australasiaticum]|nr:hypothetical protein [Candidatus Phytoplasma australasiaticum]MDV3199882.1 hypothetical protein [Candidatus Phytoplasma australasiaticum]
MNDFIKFIEIGLFCFSVYEIFFNFVMPAYFIIVKKYHLHGLRDKNIPTNINHQNKTAYIHWLPFIRSLCTLIVIGKDVYNIFFV